MNEVHLAELYKAVLKALKERQYRKAAELAAGMTAIAEMDEDWRSCLLGKYLLGNAYYHLTEYRQSMEKYVELNNLILACERDVAELDLPAGWMDRVRYGMAAAMYQLGDLDGAAVVLGHILESGADGRVVLDGAILLGVVYLMMYDLNRDARLLAATLEMYLTLLEEVRLSRPRQTMIYNNLAILFTYRQDYIQAQEMLNQAFQQVATPAEMISIFNEMSRIHLLQKNPEKVRRNLERVKAHLREEPGLPEEIQYCVLAGMLRREEERYPEALHFLEKGLYLANSYHHHIEQVRVCRELMVLSEQMASEHAEEYAQRYREGMEGVNPVKEVIPWQALWNSPETALASLPRKRIRATV